MERHSIKRRRPVPIGAMSTANRPLCTTAATISICIALDPDWRANEHRLPKRTRRHSICNELKRVSTRLPFRGVYFHHFLLVITYSHQTESSRTNDASESAPKVCFTGVFERFYYAGNTQYGECMCVF